MMGAIAICQLEGDVDRALEQITQRKNWKIGKTKLVNIPGVDEVIAVKLQHHTAQIMLHGGMQVLQAFAALCASIGIEETKKSRFVEASNSCEEAMLEALTRVASEEAIDLLLSQPEKLQNAQATPEDLMRSQRLDRLIEPPKIVLLGKPNTGKSTLMNALTKEQSSIVHELPGATRDAVTARIECCGLVVDLYDLPGFRESNDLIEQEAITIAEQLLREADLVLLIADHEQDWLQVEEKEAIRVGTKSDVRPREDADVCVAALTGVGIVELASRIRETLVPLADIQSDRPWFFMGYSPTDEYPQST